MPRQVAMYLCKALTHASLPEIGRSFGGKHHSTVIHSIKKVEEMRKKNTGIRSSGRHVAQVVQVIHSPTCGRFVNACGWGERPLRRPDSFHTLSTENKPV